MITVTKGLECSLSMARLAAAFQVRKDVLELERTKKVTKLRLMADPMVSVDQIQDALEGFMKHKKSSDLWRLISPPPSLSQISWQTPPHADWLSKVCGLMYDLVEVAKNTKLQSTKVHKALMQMHLNKQMHIPQHLGKVEDALDRMDLSLRVVMSMLRQVKIHDTTRYRVMRSLSKEEQLQLEMVLEKVVLPKECYGEGGSEMIKEDSQDQGDLALEDAAPPCLALVPIAKPTEERPPVEPAKTFRRSLQFQQEALQELSPPMPIFQKILHGTKSQRAKPEATQRNEEDPDLLTMCGNFVPAQAKQPQPKRKNKAKHGNKIQPTGHSKKSSPKKKISPKKKSIPKKKNSQKTSPQKANSGLSPRLAKYVVDVDPKESDSYRNLYTSRHYNKAKDLALRAGLSAEEAKLRGRLAGAEAAAKWDAMRN